MSTPLPQDRAPILVPLDGSELAELALPIAERLAQALRRPLLIVHVIAVNTWTYLPPSVVFPPQTYQQLVKEEDRASQQYVRDVAARLADAGVPVEARSLRGDPAATIIDTARAHRDPLIVMASHGRTGLARFALGSVADRVVTYGRMPTLLVRAVGGDTTKHPLERAIVPLDGSKTAEHALAMVERLAGNPLRTVTLLQVVDPEQQAGATEEARQYLATASQELAQRLEGRECTIATAVLYGAVDQQIIDYAADEGDLIVLGTHGRSGIGRWSYGSVASHVLHHTRTALLLVPALADASDQAEGHGLPQS